MKFTPHILRKKEVADNWERQLFAELLQRHNGCIHCCAEELKMSYQTFQQRMIRLDLRSRDFELRARTCHDGRLLSSRKNNKFMKHNNCLCLENIQKDDLT